MAQAPMRACQPDVAHASSVPCRHSWRHSVDTHVDACVRPTNYGEEDRPLAAVFALLLRAAVEVRSTGARGASQKKSGKQSAGINRPRGRAILFTRSPDRQYLHREIRVKRGRKFGNQIQSRARQQAVSCFNAPHPPAAKPCMGRGKANGCSCVRRSAMSRGPYPSPTTVSGEPK